MRGETGEVRSLVWAMPRRQGAYGVTHKPSPVAAVHPDGTRVALALKSGIAVIRLP